MVIITYGIVLVPFLLAFVAISPEKKESDNWKIYLKKFSPKKLPFRDKWIFWLTFILLPLSIIEKCSSESDNVTIEGNWKQSKRENAKLIYNDSINQVRMNTLIKDNSKLVTSDSISRNRVESLILALLDTKTELSTTRKSFDKGQIELQSTSKELINLKNVELAEIRNQSFIAEINLIDGMLAEVDRNKRIIEHLNDEHLDGFSNISSFDANTFSSQLSILGLALNLKPKEKEFILVISEEIKKLNSQLDIISKSRPGEQKIDNIRYFKTMRNTFKERQPKFIRFLNSLKKKTKDKMQTVN